MVEKKMIKNSFFENEFAESWIEDGILMEVFKPEVTSLTPQVAKRVIEDRLKVSNGVTMPLFVDFANLKSVDNETRRLFSSAHSLQYISASAFLMHSYVAFYGGRLYLLLDKPKVKTELFRTKSRAIEWLNIYKK